MEFFAMELNTELMNMEFYESIRKRQTNLVTNYRNYMIYPRISIYFWYT